MTKTNTTNPKLHTYIADSDRARPKLQVRLDTYCAEGWQRCKRAGETDGAALRRLIRAEVARISRKQA